MGTCSDCKFWGRYRHMVCDVIELGDEVIDGNAARIDVRVLDDSGLDAYLVTGPSFGCVKYEKKES
jgi:hypothetical protein